MEAERIKHADHGGTDPDILIIRPSQSKGGVTQKIVQVIIMKIHVFFFEFNQGL